MRGVLVLALISVTAPFTSGQNSTRKIRPELSAIAARAGSAVQWRAGLDAARAEARASGKPVFWYVPTLAGSPMDRRVEIDRYMLAGPFSDVDVVQLLNTAFVPVRRAADQAAARELRQPAFIEPGFVVYGADGTELLRRQALMTLHPEWFASQLRRVAGREVEPRRLPEPLRQLRAALRAGDWTAAERAAETVPPVPLAAAHRAELAWLHGAALQRTGRAAAARALWTSAAAALPDEPYAWKAAAEAEGHGPFVSGFEDYRALPAAVLAADSDSSRAPSDAYDENDVWRAGIALLTVMQNADGSFTDSRYDFGGTDSLPNVHFAVTALAATALLEARQQPAPTFDEAQCAGIGAALDRALAFVGDDAHLASGDTDEIVWAHVYRLRLCSRRLELDDSSTSRDAVVPILERSVVALTQLQQEDGAWFHEYANPFTSASVLVALHGAERAGRAVASDVVERGVRALLACRAKNGGFSYAQSRGEVSVSVAGSACRMPQCELALALWQRGREALLRAAVTAAFEHHDALAAVRKYDDHADRYGHGGFFFWYDMLGRTEALLALTDADARRELAARQQQLILSLAEIDGCFVDSHELGRVYGTAVALQCLALLRRAE